MELEDFHSIFNEFKKGNMNNYYIIVDNYLFILIDELLKVENLDDNTINIALIAYLNAIKSFSFEKASSFENFLRTYMNLSIISARENNMTVNIDFDIMFPKYNIVLKQEKILAYILKIKEKLAEEPVNSTDKLIKPKKL